jgi:hypothetical protein
MNDIEITQKIRNLKWTVDINGGIVECELVRYKIVVHKNFIDFVSEWHSKDVPPIASVLNDINMQAKDAYWTEFDKPEYKIKAPSAAYLKQFKTLKGLTGARMALLIGVAPRSVRDWLFGDRRIPLSAWRLLRLMTREAEVDDIFREIEDNQGV